MCGPAIRLGLEAPTSAKPLTGEVVANILFDHGWNLFGVPSHITVDRAAQFVGAFFRNLSRRPGIQVAYSQAYRHQGNGRAE